MRRPLVPVWTAVVSMAFLGKHAGMRLLENAAIGAASLISATSLLVILFSYWGCRITREIARWFCLSIRARFKPPVKICKGYGQQYFIIMFASDSVDYFILAFLEKKIETAGFLKVNRTVTDLFMSASVESTTQWPAVAIHRLLICSQE